MVIQHWLSRLFARLQRRVTHRRVISVRRRKLNHRRVATAVELFEPRQLLSATAVPDSYQVNQSSNPQPLTMDVLANDYSSYGSMSITYFGTVPYGSVTRLAANANGYGSPSRDELIFTPQSGYTGTESFSYTVTDSTGSQSTTTVTLTVSGMSAPVVSSLSPSSGSTSGGTSVSISGSGFNQVSAVMFGTMMASSYTVNSSTSITAVAPSHSSGSVDITVVTSMGSSTANLNDRFTYQAPSGLPTITSVSPGTETTSGGDTITITGTNFTGVSSVSFGGTAATSFTVVSPTSITAIAPAHVSGQVDIRVTSAYGTSATGATDQLMFTTPVLTPSVTGLSSNSGSTTGGSSLMIMGANFTNVTQVTFGSVPCTSFTVNSSSSITAVVPAESAGTVDVKVTNSAGTSGVTSADQYTFTSMAPVVSSLSTSSGPSTGGTSVTITGINFTGASGVLFGTVAATSYSINSPTSITAIAPAETLGVVDIKVQSSNGTSAAVAADQFTFAPPPPSVTSLSVSSGLTTGGTSIVISGSNLSTATGVTFGSVPANSYVVNSNGTITAVSPVEAFGIVDVTVTSSTGTSATSSVDRFSFVNPPPIVTGLSVSSGSTSGGTTVTISGSQFYGATSVRFGTILVNSFTINSDGSILTTAPAESAGIVDVTVSNSSGTSNTTNADHFTYVNPAPTITSLSVTSGPLAGGTSVLIHGTNLAGATSVKFGSVTSSFTSNADGTITAVSPAESAGVVDVTVTTGNGTSAASANDQFTFGNVPPVVTGLSVSVGSTAASTTLTISGSHFSNATAIHFGSAPASSFTINNDGSITATAAAQAAATVDVTVTNAGGVSSTSSADQFTFANAPPTVTGLSLSVGALYGGTVVTISGQNLTGATSINFGSLPATSFKINSSGSIVAIAPAGSVGIVDVTVTTAGGTSTTSTADRFTYVTPDNNSSTTPIVSGISDNTDSTSGGTSVTIHGVNFTGVTSVLFGTVPSASFTVDSDISITAVVPAQSGNAVNITLTSPAGTSITSSADQFIYSDPNALPSVSGITQSGLGSGIGSLITITGSNLKDATGVQFGDTPAVFVVQSATSILAIVPSGVTGATPVTVTTAAGSSASSPSSQFTVSLAPLTVPWGTVPTPTGADFVVTPTALGFVPSFGFGGSTGPSSVPNPPSVPTNHPTTTAWSDFGTGTWGFVTQDSGMIYTPDNSISVDTNGLVHVNQFSTREIFTNVIRSSSAGIASQVITLQIEEILNEAILGANGTGTILTSDSIITSSWVATTTQGVWRYSTGTVDKTVTGRNERGDNGGPNSAYGTTSTDTITEQELDVTIDGNGMSGTKTDGIYLDFQKGNDLYAEGEQIQTLTGSETDTLWGSDKWKGGDGGNFAFYADGTRTVQSGYFGSSSGSDTYFDGGSDKSTTVTNSATGTVTEFDNVLFSDNGFDEYNFSSDGNISVARNGTISSIDNHNDTDDGNEDQKVSDTGWITDNETLADGTTIQFRDDFGESNEDKSKYNDGDSQNASTASGGTDTLNDDAKDNVNFSTNDKIQEIVTWVNSFGTPTIATITDQSGDQGTLTDEAKDGDTETLGAGEVDLDDNINFDTKFNEQDTATDNFKMVITTNGQVGVGEFLNSTETFTILDTSPSSDDFDDPGTDDVTPTNNTESDTSTETAKTKDNALIEDKLDATDTLTLPDGTVITTTAKNDDTDEVEDEETDADTDHSTNQHAASASTPTTTDDDVFDDEFQETDQYTNDDKISQTITQPIIGGTLTYGLNLEVDDEGTLGETDSIDGEENTANPSADSETDDSDLTNNYQGTYSTSDYLDLSATAPDTGVVTTIHTDDTITDQFTDKNDDDLGHSSSGGSAGTQTETGDAGKTDDYQGETHSKITVNGTPYPGETISYLQDFQVTGNGGDSYDTTFTSSALGQLVDTGTFSNHAGGTITESGYSKISTLLTTDDGHGTVTSTNETDNVTFSEPGTYQDSDSGGDSLTDSGGQPTAFSESDTSSESETLNPTSIDTSTSNDTVTSVDPQTGLTTIETYISSNTSTLSEQDAATQGDVHSEALGTSGSDSLSDSNNLSGTESSTDNSTDTIQINGVLPTGITVSMVDRIILSDNSQGTFLDTDSIAPDGSRSDGSRFSGSFNIPTLYETESGTLASTNPTTGITTTTTLSDIIDSSVTDTESDSESDIISATGISTDTLNVNNSGQSRLAWSLTTIISQVDASGNSVGAPVTTTDIGSDSQTDSNGVVSDGGGTNTHTTSVAASASPPAAPSVPAPGQLLNAQFAAANAAPAANGAQASSNSEPAPWYNDHWSDWVNPGCWWPLRKLSELGAIDIHRTNWEQDIKITEQIQQQKLTIQENCNADKDEGIAIAQKRGMKPLGSTTVGGIQAAEEFAASNFPGAGGVMQPSIRPPAGGGTPFAPTGVSGGVQSAASQKAKNYVLFNKTHGNSLPSPKGTGPNGGRLQSHHGLQKAWANENLRKFKYDEDLAPTVTLETGTGYPHTAITNLQRIRRDDRIKGGLGAFSSTLDEELEFIVEDFRAAGFEDDVIKQVLEQNYKMLDKLGVTYTKPEGF